MEEFKLSDDVFEQIKDFNHWELTDEQKLLIDKLILNEELKERYKCNGLCKECKQPNTGNGWCKSCNVKHFQQNFNNWTSGNNEVDKFIQKTQLRAKRYEEILEWIEYDRFENVEYLAKGGFGTIYKAIWKDGYIEEWDSENNQWERKEYWIQHKNFPVVLKCLHNSQNVTSEFLREIESHTMIISDGVTRCFGITKDPESNNFMMVIEYAEEGSLRQYLNNTFNSIKWVDKLNILQRIAAGLLSIHEKELIHRDFHCGNMLKDNDYTIITDLGLCQPANVKPSQNEYEKQVYGVLPYVAPEVLRGKEYTQESDIYAFGIITYEVCTGLPPYHDIAHDKILAISICQGLRPKSDYKIPQLILNIIKQCWDADPSKRPKANELYDSLDNLYDKLLDDSDDSEIKKQVEEAERINEKITSTSLPYNGTTLSYTTNPQAVYTSRLLNFKNLPEPKNAIDNKDDNNSIGEYSGN
ncbi:kinase-like domain-containing protein [Rhizophagus irregularis DAOM 181602=DAOM 197198]|uniref:Kic1p n=2 Tax=Rhizophagus irregularis TaxID=588596 RepID=A0A015KVW6_RHIIW|nr:kinase-like domain-containing protein [Rhizophagus irregularis DAOM 181602=DAOM 197198]EXX64131.1 Kic1p [Rhizophagus irregularis DAOM 197198w]POG71872.1 kinase-like domain-containing protein [Rhizophagus irregularis DAOM 181602=DAOM 197198]|eukprot:XP_025178738.1 kinase-like domain-containing protein [Rhizophagus irregularis DAOM 181602=DAOM 197198]